MCWCTNLVFVAGWGFQLGSYKVGCLLFCKLGHKRVLLGYLNWVLNLGWKIVAEEVKFWILVKGCWGMVGDSG